jgi:hypothetical protein
MLVTEGIFPFFMLLLLTLFAAGVSLDSESERRRTERGLRTSGQSRAASERR